MVRWYVFAFSVRLSSARRNFWAVFELFGSSESPQAMLKLEGTDRHSRMNQLGLSFCMGSPTARKFLLLARIAAVLARVPRVVGTKKTVSLYLCGGSHAKRVEMYCQLSIPRGSLISHGANVRRTVNMFGANLSHRLRAELLVLYLTRKYFHVPSRARVFGGFCDSCARKSRRFVGAGFTRMCAPSLFRTCYSCLVKLPWHFTAAVEQTK